MVYLERTGADPPTAVHEVQCSADRTPTQLQSRAGCLDSRSKATMCRAHVLPRTMARAGARRSTLAALCPSADPGFAREEAVPHPPHIQSRTATRYTGPCARAQSPQSRAVLHLRPVP
eukprot:3166192-Rhodomonas_salina.2